jgi:hypothetical protein
MLRVEDSPPNTHQKLRHAIGLEKRDEVTKTHELIGRLGAFSPGPAVSSHLKAPEWQDKAFKPARTERHEDSRL